MWIRTGFGVTERSRRFLGRDNSRERPLFSLFLSTDVGRRFSSFEMLLLCGLRSRDRDRRRSSVFRPLVDLPSGFADRLLGDTDLRRVLDRSLELDEDDEDEDDELDELDPELLRDEDEDELGMNKQRLESPG